MLSTRTTSSHRREWLLNIGRIQSSVDRYTRTYMFVSNYSMVFDSQWHCTPFDERNCDLRFLHRCSVDLTSSSGSPRGFPRLSQDSADGNGRSNKSRSASNDYDALKGSLDEDEELVFQRPKAAARLGDAAHLNGNGADTAPASGSDSNRPRKSSSALDRYLASLDGAAAEGAAPKSKARLLLQTHGGKLRDAYDSLATCRSLLWEELQRSLVDMLNLMAFNSAVKSDDYLSMVRPAGYSLSLSH